MWLPVKRTTGAIVRVASPGDSEEHGDERPVIGRTVCRVGEPVSRHRAAGGGPGAGDAAGQRHPMGAMSATRNGLETRFAANAVESA